MTKIVALVSLFLSVIEVAAAGISASVPKIAPASGLSALAFLSGALLVIRGRKK